jgi:hypothetical protein
VGVQHGRRAIALAAGLAVAALVSQGGSERCEAPPPARSLPAAARIAPARDRAAAAAIHALARRVSLPLPSVSALAATTAPRAPLHVLPDLAPPRAAPAAVPEPPASGLAFAAVAAAAAGLLGRRRLH